MPSRDEIGRWLVIVLWLLEIILLLSDADLLKTVMSALLAGYLLVVSGLVRPGTRALALSLLTVALIASLLAGESDGALAGLEFATAFPAFLATMALLRATALVHPTIAAIRSNIAKLRDIDRQSGFMIASHFLGAIITAGTFGILSPLAPEGCPDEARRRLAIACLRGVNLAVLWSPFFVGTAVVTHYLPDLPLWQIFLQGSLMAALAYALILLPGDRESRAGLLQALRQLMPLAPPVLVLALMVITMATVSRLSALQSVFLIVPPVVGIYLVFQPRPSRRQAFSTCWQSLALIKDELVLVTSVGVLSLSLAQAPGADRLVAWLLDWGLPPSLLAVLLLTIILCFAMTGVHPMATASVMLALLAADGPLSDLTLAAIGLLSWGLGTMISPGSITVLIASNLFDVPARKLVFSSNLIFVFGFGALAVTLSAWIAS